MALAKVTLSDVVFAALLLWLVGYTWAGGSPSLLHDASTGMHIRTGEFILDHRTVPRTDIFSFSRPGQPWFAWEWLADAGMAVLYRLAGLKAVVLAAAVCIALAFWISVRHAVRLGANPLAAIAVLHVGVGASSHHFLARPHALTLLFMAAGWWALDRDSGRPTRAVWLLVPLTALWVNLHGGFVAILISLVVFAAGSALERRRQARRYVALAAACGAASVLNPYGLRLFSHLNEYLRADWIRQWVEEFQPPRLGSPAGAYFELLLFAGLGTAALLAARGRHAHALLIAAWAHASLLSMRHIPIFFLIAGPMIAVELSAIWRHTVNQVSQTAAPALLWRIGERFRPQFGRGGAAGVGLVAVLLLPGLDAFWPKDFPARRYPVELARRHAARLAGTRLFTLDTWADFLIYEFYPRQKVFFDGRTDFYGQAIAEDYVRLVRGESGWQELVRRYGFETALLPADCPLTGLLMHLEGWKPEAKAAGAVLLVRPRADSRASSAPGKSPSSGCGPLPARSSSG